MRKGTKAQSKPPKPVERLLRTIRQVRSARHSQKLEELSESELLIYMADILSDDPHERRLIACALAADFARGPDDNNVDKACELLEDMGVSGFEPEGLIAMRASPVFREFQQVERDYPLMASTMIGTMSRSPSALSGFVRSPLPLGPLQYRLRQRAGKADCFR